MYYAEDLDSILILTTSSNKGLYRQISHITGGAKSESG